MMFDSVATLVADLDAFVQNDPAAVCRRARVSTDAGRLILLLAAGKRADIPGLNADDAEHLQALGVAARRVIAEVFLAPDADHFITLGLSPDADNAAIREHFRRLMAVVHPDAKPIGFPDDAAVRVNQAYAVLSSEESKSAYLDALVRPLGEATPTAVMHAGSAGRSASRGPRARAPWRGLLGALFAALRTRNALLWFALILIVPFVALLVPAFQRAEPVRLVEARPAESDSKGAASYSAPTRPVEAVTVTGNLIATPPPVADASPAGANTPGARVDGLSLTAGFGKRSLELLAERRAGAQAPGSERQTAAASRSGAPPLAPVAPAAAGADVALPIARGPVPVDGGLRPAAPPLRDAVPMVAVAEPPATAVSAPPAAANQTLPVNSPAQRAQVAVEATSFRTGELDDLLVRFANAYESGSITGFAQLFSPNMSGRRQMLMEYERMFAATRSRTIKFNQLKHSMNGERVSTAGYATVTTIDQDNRSATQRVFLEFEIGRDRGQPRIERLANYAIN